MSRRLSFTERRRRRLARQIDSLDRLEPRAMIVEPISLTGLSISWIRGAVQLGLVSPFMASNALSGLGRHNQKAAAARPATMLSFAPHRNLLAPIATPKPGPHSSGWQHDRDFPAAGAANPDPSNDWLALFVPSDQHGAESHGISLPWKPSKPNGGGPTTQPHGGANPSSPIRTTSRGAITPLRLPPSTPAASSAGGSAALLAAVASASTGASTAGSPIHAANNQQPTTSLPIRQLATTNQQLTTSPPIRQLATNNQQLTSSLPSQLATNNQQLTSLGCPPFCGPPQMGDR